MLHGKRRRNVNNIKVIKISNNGVVLVPRSKTQTSRLENMKTNYLKLELCTSVAATRMQITTTITGNKPIWCDCTK